MSKETLTVRNFGPIREADLDLRKVTVFIGEQASGKSCLAKLVHILGQVDISSKWDNFTQLLNNYHTAKFLEHTTQITCAINGYNFSFNEGVTRFSYKPGGNLMVDEYLKVQSKFRQFDNVIFTDLIDSAIFKDNQQLVNSVYVPTERIFPYILGEGGLSIMEFTRTLFPYLIKFSRELKVAQDQIKNLIYNPLSLNFTVEVDNKITVRHNGSSFELKDASSGLQSIAPILWIVENNNLKKTIFNKQFIIEEPELNLYPTTQKKLVEYLIEKCAKGDNRLVITTHSPYILTALNNCIEAANVRSSNPEAAAEVDKLVPRQSQIDFEDVAAYFVGGGTARSIMNHENRLIDANALDEISEEIGRTFDQLLDLKYQHQD